MEREALKDAVREAIKEELGPLFIEREQHYLDHKFISSVRTFNDKVKGQACKTVTNGILATLGILLVWGLYHVAEIVWSSIGKGKLQP